VLPQAYAAEKAEEFVKYFSAKPGKPPDLLPALGAALANVWLSIAGASVRAAPVLPMLVGPYRRFPALRGARTQSGIKAGSEFVTILKDTRKCTQ
jgi:hypothetical protein